MTFDGQGSINWVGASVEGIEPLQFSGDEEREEEFREWAEELDLRDMGNDGTSRDESIVASIII